MYQLAYPQVKNIIVRNLFSSVQKPQRGRIVIQPRRIDEKENNQHAQPDSKPNVAEPNRARFLRQLCERLFTSSSVLISIAG